MKLNRMGRSASTRRMDCVRNGTDGAKRSTMLRTKGHRLSKNARSAAGAVLVFLRRKPKVYVLLYGRPMMSKRTHDTLNATKAIQTALSSPCHVLRHRDKTGSNAHC